jgi:hypothetical protein
VIEVHELTHRQRLRRQLRVQAHQPRRRADRDQRTRAQGRLDDALQKTRMPGRAGELLDERSQLTLRRLRPLERRAQQQVLLAEIHRRLGGCRRPDARHQTASFSVRRARPKPRSTTFPIRQPNRAGVGPISADRSRAAPAAPRLQEAGG